MDDVSITLTPGVWGLLGANGAGKTALNADAGGHSAAQQADFVRWGGDWDAWCGLPGKLGYLPQRFGFYPEFTVGLSGIYGGTQGSAAYRGCPADDALLERVSLTGAPQKIVKLSGGMKRRVGIAQALLNDEILILDEPTAGLDPGERVRFRNLLSEFAQERIVLISAYRFGCGIHLQLKMP